MSIVCFRIPHFLFALAAQEHPQWAEKPIALLGSDECVWAVSPPAGASGVQIGMPARQARSHCADVACQSLDLHASEDTQHYFLDTLAQSGLPVELQDWGLAYVDLNAVSDSPRNASPVCAQLGQQVRQRLGQYLQPTVGCDSGKFTARAAANAAQPGHLRIVDRSNQVSFLDPLPVTWLPLPAPALQQLDWLGIRTLGQFSKLPVSSVVQRFGPSGRLALSWARGRDDRPVRATVTAAPSPVVIDFEAPTRSHEMAASTAMQALAPHLNALAERLEGCRRLRATLHFLDGNAHTTQQAFVEPLSQAVHVQTAVRQMLQSYTWPAELNSLEITLLELAELRPQQLTLFAGTELGTSEREDDPFARLVIQLTARYGKVFLKASLMDERHTVPERRFNWSNL